MCCFGLSPFKPRVEFYVDPFGCESTTLLLVDPPDLNRTSEFVPVGITGVGGVSPEPGAEGSTLCSSLLLQPDFPTETFLVDQLDDTKLSDTFQTKCPSVIRSSY